MCNNFYERHKQMKNPIKLSLIVLISAGVLVACASGSSGSTSTTPTVSAGVVAFDTNNQLYVNSNNQFYKVATTGIPSTATINDLKCDAYICSLATSEGLFMSNNLENWTPVLEQSLNAYKLQTESPTTVIANSTVVINYGNYDGSINNYIYSAGNTGNITHGETSSTSGTTIPSSVTTVPSTTQNNLNAIVSKTWGASSNTIQYILVGDAGTILSSTDMKNFSTITSNTTNNLNDIACSYTTCIVVGDNGTILITNDGQNFRAATSGTTQNLTSITVTSNSSSSWTASGSSGAVYSSDDGVAWKSSNTTALSNTYSMGTMASSGTQLIATVSSTDSTAATNQLLVSNDQGQSFNIISLGGPSTTVPALKAVYSTGTGFVPQSASGTTVGMTPMPVGIPATPSITY